MAKEDYLRCLPYKTRKSVVDKNGSLFENSATFESQKNMNLLSSPKKIVSLCGLALIIQAFTWVAVWQFIWHAAAHDTIETIVWGTQLQWGYDKNPWFVAVVARAGIVLSHHSMLGVYFIKECFSVLAFASVAVFTYLLAKEIETPHRLAYRYAIIASLMLQGTVCYTIHVALYNDNFILAALYPLSAVFLYQAIKTDRWRYWLSLSICLALAVMAKYDAIIFVAVYWLYLLFSPYRHRLLSIKVFLSILLFLIVITPNLIWLYQHDFITLQYAFITKGGLGSHPTNSLGNKLDFLQSNAIDFLPALVLMACAITTRKSSEKKRSLTKTATQFLLWVSLGPFLFLLLSTTVANINLVHEWGIAFMPLWGSCLLLCWRPRVTARSFQRFVVLIFSLMLLIWPAGYIIYSLQHNSGAYPAKEIAARATSLWHQHFHTPLAFVAGNRYVAGYVSFHSPDHPSVLIDANVAYSPWVSIRDFRCHGAVFLQDSTTEEFEALNSGLNFQTTRFNAQLQQHYPTLIILPIESIPLYRKPNDQSNIKLLIGLLPPDPAYCQTPPK